MWESGTFQEVEVCSPEIQHVIDALVDTHVNGGALIKCFTVTDKRVFKFPIMMEDYKPYFQRLLTSPDIRQSLEELRIGDSLEHDPQFAQTSPLILDGQVAERLVFGGAYKEFIGTPKQAKNLSQQFIQCIFGDRYSDVRIYTSHVSWCDWFYDIAWDTTWLIFDQPMNKLWIVCMTDTD